MKKMRTDDFSEPDEMLAPPEEPEGLRSGFTTGTASVAAALAAVELLSGGKVPAAVSVCLPGGDSLEVAVAGGAMFNRDEAMAVVVKDAGDDPDITNGAEIGAIVRRRSEPGLVRIIGGRGVGKVTRPGLAVPPGQWAINPVPRAMLLDHLTALLKPGVLPGLEVEIFVEKGEELAAKTLNPRLGIIGGISILGTTGLVKPFSHEAYIATIESALNLALAAGLTEIVFTTGRRSEQLAMRHRPDLKPEAFIQIADFFGAALEMAGARGVAITGLAVFFGKAVKQAAGHYNTHAHRGDQDLRLLADWLAGDIDEATAVQISESVTARGALEILRQTGRAEIAAKAVNKVAEKALASAHGFAGPGPELWMTIFDYDDRLLAEAALPR